MKKLIGGHFSSLSNSSRILKYKVHQYYRIFYILQYQSMEAQVHLIHLVKSINGSQMSDVFWEFIKIVRNNWQVDSDCTIIFKFFALIRISDIGFDFRRSKNPVRIFQNSNIFKFRHSSTCYEWNSNILWLNRKLDWHEWLVERDNLIWNSWGCEFYFKTHTTPKIEVIFVLCRNIPDKVISFIKHRDLNYEYQYWLYEVQLICARCNQETATTF